MSLLNDVVNNDNISGTVKGIYKYIEKHEKDINEVIDMVYTDLSSLFKNVSKDNDIVVITIKPNDIDNQMMMIKNSITKQFDSVMPDADFSWSYIFNVYNDENKIYIANKFNKEIAG